MQTDNELLDRIAELIKRALESFASAHPLGPQLLYTRSQAANLLGLGVASLDMLIGRGDIRVRHFGSKVLIAHEELVRVSKKDFDAIWPEKTNGTKQQESPKP